MAISQTSADEPVTARLAPTGERRLPHTAIKPPSLENGDRLTRAEFERRHEAMPEVKKAELIDGVVYVGSPVRFRAHGRPHLLLLTWLGMYSAFTPDVLGADNTTVRLGPDTEPQPDALLRLDPEAGGISRVSDDDYIEGAPEFVAEIAASSASYDLHDKMDAYRRAGVKEYLVWRVDDGQIDWFALYDGDYVRLTPDESGVTSSRVFPGLRLLLPALLASDMDRVVTELQNGLATAEHAAFVARPR